MTILNNLTHDVKYVFADSSRHAFPDDKFYLLND